MEYIKGTPYFCKSIDKIKQFPYLNTDLTTDVLIVGGGIDGAILNYHLSKNYDTVLVDKSRLGYACTPCATALLEYQLDDFAEELLGELTENEIVDIYKMGLESIKVIDKIVNKLGNTCEFTKRPSFLYSNKIGDISSIKKEYEFRKKHNFESVFYDAYYNPFPFNIKAGLYCSDGGAEFNPYLFTKLMIDNSNNQNKIFENTKIETVKDTGNGFIATTNFGEKINCKRVVYATGFNWETYSDIDLCTRYISYSIVTNKVSDFSWFNNALIQDNDEPYHYLRILPDNRLIYGGEDVRHYGNEICSFVSKIKYKKLYNSLLKMFPELENKIQIEYKFCGAFGTTKNNLGLIGRTNNPNIYYFISCGANGIINSIFGMNLIEDLFENRTNKLEKVFSPMRVIEKK